jgi:hypothetical protein
MNMVLSDGLLRVYAPAVTTRARASSPTLLTLSLAHHTGSNPDLIRREQRAYREAGAAAETQADW